MSYAYDFDEDTMTAGCPPWMPTLSPLSSPELADESVCAPQAHILEPPSYFAVKALRIGAPTFTLEQSACTAPMGRRVRLYRTGAVLSHVVCLDYLTTPVIYTERESGTNSALTLMTVCSNAANTMTTTIAAPVRRDPLKGYERYSERDWDGYDADPISPETLNAARTFLRLLPLTLGDPDIAPGSDGTIGLEWQFSDRPLKKLFIDIGPGRVWKGFWRKASGEHNLLPERGIGSDTAFHLSDLFNELDE